MHAFTIAIVHACTIAIIYACTIATIHACTIAIIHACIIAIIHTCIVAIIHVSCPVGLICLAVEAGCLRGFAPQVSRLVLGATSPKGWGITGGGQAMDFWTISGDG